MFKYTKTNDRGLGIQGQGNTKFISFLKAAQNK